MNFGCLFTIAGIFLSYYLNMPSGPMIILSLFLLMSQF
ncbi:MAG: metal ABC transporter permease [Candidatus Pacebacteria bacterium]|nr:metal ABC transporter permease [Candidatus Paceibacterota bacterium]